MERKRFKYSENDMLRALAAVENGMSVYSAAKAFKVPRMTLSDKVRGKTPIIRKMGPPSILSYEEEMLLEKWILHLASVRFPVTKEQLLDSVQMLSKQLGKQDKFPNGRPGRRWYEAFLKRHPTIAERNAQNLTARRAAVTEENLRNWFSEVKTYLTVNNLLDIFNDPRRIYNCDETAFFFSPKDNRVLAKKGQKTVHTVISSDEKECITTLIMGNAAGNIAPPMIVVNLKRIPQKLAHSVPESWAIGRSENGWMTGETFFEYFANVFHPWLVQNNIEFPVIVFCDGHSSHLTMALSEFCKNNSIELIALYPNATQILQPMDVAVFHPLKVAWKKAVYAHRIRNAGLPLKRDNFCPILNEALQSLTPDILKNGFRRCGLCPFEADALDYTQLSGDQKSKGTTQLHEPKILEHFMFIEENIPPEKLTNFKNSNETWMGALEDTSLFSFWKKVKNRVTQGNSTEINTEINNNELSNCQFDNNDISQLTNQEDSETYYLENELNSNMLDDQHGDVLVHEVTNTGELVRISTQGRNDQTQKMNLEEADSVIIMNRPSAEESRTTTYESPPVEALMKVDSVTIMNIPPAEESRTATTCESPPAEALMKGDSVTVMDTPPAEESRTATTFESPPAEALIKEPAIMEEFPTPFKKTLYWPSTSTANSKPQRKKRNKEKVPAVATSIEWQQYFLKKEQEKEEKIRKTEENKRKREENANKKKEEKVAGKKLPCKDTKRKKNDSSRWYCKICEEEFEKDMIQCLSCGCWVHEVCAGVSKSAKEFYCSICKA